MSTNGVMNTCMKFMTDSTPQVLAIKGAWGTGKTYAWKEMIRGLGDCTALDKYCYLSLFGVATIADLRTAIIAKRIVGTKRSEKIANRTVGALADAWRAAGVPKYVYAALDLATVLGSSVFTGMTLCLDDLERSPIDHCKLLGFISELKTENGCRVALIFNEDELKGDVYKTYHEKVVDIELSFSPSPDDLLEWGLDKGLRQQDRDRIIACARKLNIRNIRILQRISRVYEQIYRVIAQCGDPVIQEAVETLVLLTFASCATDDEVPSIAFIRAWNAMEGAFRTDEEGQSREREEWNDYLRQYGVFDHLNPLGEAILGVVERGYVEESELEEAAKERAKDRNAHELERNLTAVWRLFWDSFLDNTDDVVKDMQAKLRACIDAHLPAESLVAGLDGFVELLRALENPAAADGLIDAYFTQYVDDVPCEQHRHPVWDEVRDPELSQRLKEHCQQRPSRPTILAATRRVAAGRGVLREDITVLSGAGSEDFYQIFRNYQGDDFSRIIGACLDLGHRMGGGTEDAKVAQEAAYEALNRISQEGPLINRVRVERYLRRFPRKGDQRSV